MAELAELAEYCKKEDEENIAKKICVHVKNFPCLYDQSDKDYYTQKAKEKAFTVIANKINVEFQLEEGLNWSNLKKRWDNIRKYFVKKLHTNSHHYLSNELEFLKPYIKSSKVSKSQLPQSLPTIQHMVASVLEDDNNGPRTCDDFQSSTIDESPSTSRFHLQCLTKNKSTKQTQMSTEIKTTQQEIKETQAKVIPPVSQSYLNQENHLIKLKKQSMEVTGAALKSIEELIKTSSIDENYDDYLLSIKQSLSYVPETHLLECTDEILNIIDTYVEENVSQSLSS